MKFEKQDYIRLLASLLLVALATPAYASDFSGMLYIFVGVFIVGLLVVGGSAWVISLFIKDQTIKWFVRIAGVAGFCLLFVLFILGF